MFQKRTIVVGVTGGIAAYKTCTLVSMLVKAHADVHVIMTPHATEFVSPLAFETLSKNRVITETFDRDFEWDVKHVSLASQAAAFVVAPATANFVGKLASGIADDFLTTTAMAMSCPTLICPAMNFRMLDAPATSSNLQLLKDRGYRILLGGSGYLACGEVGNGRMAEPEEIFENIKQIMLPKHDLVGKKLLITSGATREDVDGVRCITNYSTGKMGSAIADAAVLRGAEVTFVEGLSTVHPTQHVRLIRVTSTMEMYDAVMAELPKQDVVIKAAAPADYRVQNVAESKIKGENVMLELVKNPDIAQAVGQAKQNDQKLVIFCAETGDPVKSAEEKRIRKHADMVIANDVTAQGAGFGTDTNIVTMIGENFRETTGCISKREVAELILDRLHDC